MFWTACKSFFIMALITGAIYPFLITEIATITMPYQAKGSLVVVNGQIKGSELIAQPFTQEHYFWPRPSAIDFNPLHSGGSNLGPSSLKLKKLVEERANQLAQTHHTSPLNVPADLVYASGSGLDPHITAMSAFFQLDRVSKARGLSAENSQKLKKMIIDHFEGSYGLLGPPHINVFKFNQVLDQEFSFHGQP